LKEILTNFKPERQVNTDAPEMPAISYFDSYHPYEEHLDFLEDLVAAFPDNAEMIIAGESYEGCEIHGIHIWGKGGNTSTQAIYWHGTTHAREWISAMVSSALFSIYADSQEHIGM
jgi:hypothetical protein